MYYAFKSTKDTFIDQLKSGSNYGEDELLEVGNPRYSNNYSYKIRSLIQFNTDDIIDKRNNGAISTSSQYELKLYECNSSKFLQDDFYIDVYLLSQSWNEGTGSRDGYHENGYSNWLSASNNIPWSSTGGAIISSISASQYFVTGSGDLIIDVSPLINPIISGTYDNHGFLLQIRDENSHNNFNQKYFYGRETHTIYEPVLYAKWNDVSTTTITTSSTYVNYDVNLKSPHSKYSIKERVRFELFNRLQYPAFTYATWSLDDLQNTALENLSYSIRDLYADEVIIPFSPFTSCSYNSTMNYFIFDMNVLTSYRTYELIIKHNFFGTTKYYTVHQFQTND